MGYTTILACAQMECVHNSGGECICHHIVLDCFGSCLFYKRDSEKQPFRRHLRISDTTEDEERAVLDFLEKYRKEREK